MHSLPGRSLALKCLIVAAVCAAMGGTMIAAPPDQDNDGIKDRKDKCADTAVGTKVDRHGCPVDYDGDGVHDGIDLCGRTPAGWPVDADGCPADTDQDAVPDGADACAATPLDAVVNAAGCPSDADGDGVLDGLDRCDDSPQGAHIDRLGCPFDSDHDGIADGIDACADTRRGTPVDASGCDATPKAGQLFSDGEDTLVLGGVTFESNEVLIVPDSAVQLSHLAAYLRDWPDVRIEIRAYTDASGGTWHNVELSERRAEVVKAYLATKGIDPGRMMTRGMGEGRPIADNRTPDGRARNRRIEIVRVEGSREAAL